MSENSGFQFTDDAVPKAYDEVMVPRMFEPWAELLLDDADLQQGAAVLDVATGPGTVARLAARRVGAGGRVVAADISRPMLNVAQAKPALPGAAPITYIESPAAPLAVESAAFDRALCQQGLQFFPDRLAALREMRRALKPGGRLAVAVWSHIEHNVIYAALHAALRDTVPAELADRLLGPFSWPDDAAVRDAIQAAGFPEVSVRRATLPLIFEGGIAEAAKTLSATPLAPALAGLPAAKQAELSAVVAARLTPMQRNGRVQGDMTSTIAVARA
jgi:ubiquinone/menaquinone biosynthesis C-methylase UbiE